MIQLTLGHLKHKRTHQVLLHVNYLCHLLLLLQRSSLKSGWDESLVKVCSSYLYTEPTTAMAMRHFNFITNKC